MKHGFCDHCPGCRPSLVNEKTGKIMADDDPVMITVNRVWDNDTTYEMRRAFVEVTNNNSRDKKDVLLANQFGEKVQKAIERMLN